MYYYNIWSGQIIIFHQPRFPWNKGISLPQLPFEVRSCEVAIIWPDMIYLDIHILNNQFFSDSSNPPIFVFGKGTRPRATSYSLSWLAKALGLDLKDASISGNGCANHAVFDPPWKLTASLHLKMDGWNTSLSFWDAPYFQGQTCC